MFTVVTTTVGLTPVDGVFSVVNVSLQRLVELGKYTNQTGVGPRDMLLLIWTVEKHALYLFLFFVPVF